MITLNEPTIPVTTITLLIPLITALVGGLVVYIFKKKDKSEEDTSETLKIIQTTLNSININISTVKKEVESMIYDTRQLQRKEEIINGKVGELALTVGKMETLIPQLNRRIELIENKILK